VPLVRVVPEFVRFPFTTNLLPVPTPRIPLLANLAKVVKFRAYSPFGSVRPLPTAGVSTTIHVEHLSSYLTCLYQVEHSSDNVLYLYDFPNWLPCLKRFLGTILVQWCVHDARGYGVEPDIFFNYSIARL
jgi:hypothetical protein